MTRVIWMKADLVRHLLLPHPKFEKAYSFSDLYRLFSLDALSEMHARLHHGDSHGPEKR